MTDFIKKFGHQDVLVLCTKDDFLLAGVGSDVYGYNNEKLQFKKAIFPGDKIHVIKSSDFGLLFLGRHKLVISQLENLQIVIKCQIVANDWILDADFNSADNVIFLTAHNQVQKWHVPSKTLVAKSSSTERCILYSGTLSKSQDDIFALAGTVFSEVLLWKPNFQSQEPSQILHRFQGHKGVIFSIKVSTIQNQLALCTTSDDRSVILRLGNDFETLNELSPFYGHTSRVWKSEIVADRLLTVGEDSLVCIWNFDGTLVKKVKLHQGGGIRSILYHDDSIFTGGTDGGIFKTNFQLLVNVPKAIKFEKTLFDGSVPRKVKFADNGLLAVLSDKYLFYNVSRNSVTKQVLEEKFQGKCTDLGIYEEFIVFTTVSGYLVRFDTSNAHFSHFEVSQGVRCESLRIREKDILVQVSNGTAVLFKRINGEISYVNFFVIPKCKERSANCFLRIGSKIVIGDRMGHLHLYEVTSGSALQTIHNLHSFLGVSDILMAWHGTIFTCGAGGWVKEVSLQGDEMMISQSFSVPMESAVRFIKNDQKIIIAGFHSTKVILWDLEKRLVISSFNCGGGHRSFDFFPIDENLQFVYIKDKELLQVSFGTNFGNIIRNGYHTKVINALEVVEMGAEAVIVSGGDDTMLRVGRIQDNDILDVSILEHHISSIRALHVFTHGRKQMIVSAGGREQLSISEFKGSSSQEVRSYFGENSAADSRFMCINSIIIKDKEFLLVGCSDCSIRIFTTDLELLSSLTYSHCILRLAAIKHYVISFATDGKATFWNFDEFFKDGLSVPREFCFQILLHQSGINSSLVVERFLDEFVLVTGGDDNCLSFVTLRFENESIKEMSRFSTSGAHYCQITGIVRHKDWLVSTGIDQKVILHHLHSKPGKTDAEQVGEVSVSVPDAHGLSLIDADDKKITVCVYGKGIEVVEIGLI